MKTPVVELSLPINFANKILSLKFSQGVLQVLSFLKISVLLPVCCFEKSCIILKSNFGGILFQKLLSIQQCCKLSVGYLPEDFQIEFCNFISAHLVVRISFPQRLPVMSNKVSKFSLYFVFIKSYHNHVCNLILTPWYIYSS